MKEYTIVEEHCITYNDNREDFFTEDFVEAEEKFNNEKEEIRQFFTKIYIEMNGDYHEDNCTVHYSNLQ